MKNEDQDRITDGEDEEDFLSFPAAIDITSGISDANWSDGGADYTPDDDEVAMQNRVDDNLHEAPEDLDIELFVIELDPDWRDHFRTIDEAFCHYWKYLSTEAKDDAIQRITGNRRSILTGKSSDSSYPGIDEFVNEFSMAALTKMPLRDAVILAFIAGRRYEAEKDLEHLRRTQNEQDH